MTIRIQNLRGSQTTIPTPRLRKIARIISAASGCPDAELSILITRDVEIRALNRVWRRQDRATDVLSFPQREGDGPRGGGERGALLGDVVISIDTAGRQAASRGHSLEEEVKRLLVHGLLHLLGYDHIHGGRQAAKMRREEERLMRLLADPG